MGWRSFLVVFATFVAYCFGAWADDALSRSNDPREVTAVQLPTRVAQANAPSAVSPLRPAQGQPRYATMNPPPPEEMPAAPAAAPTTPVSVAPADASPPYAQQQMTQPRYASQRPVPDERITVASLRPGEDTLYRLGPGDKLRLTVFNETDLSGEFSIDGQGYVRLPLVGQVQAAGLTSFGLETRIGEAFVGGGFLLNPRVAVEIVGYRPFYIIGEVAKPGEYPYVNAMSVPNAIALAGGYSDRAVKSTIWIRRQGDSKERELPADERTRILPGDVIRVERTTYWALMTILAPLISPFATTAYLLK